MSLNTSYRIRFATILLACAVAQPASAQYKIDPVTPADFNATIGAALGLPLDKRMFAPNGRPFFIANQGKRAEED